MSLVLYLFYSLVYFLLLFLSIYYLVFCFFLFLIFFLFLPFFVFLFISFCSYFFFSTVFIIHFIPSCSFTTSHSPPLLFFHPFFISRSSLHHSQHPVFLNHLSTHHIALTSTSCLFIHSLWHSTFSTSSSLHPNPHLLPILLPLAASNLVTPSFHIAWLPYQVHISTHSTFHSSLSTSSSLYPYLHLQFPPLQYRQHPILSHHLLCQLPHFYYSLFSEERLLSPALFVSPAMPRCWCPWTVWSLFSGCFSVPSIYFFIFPSIL